MKNEAPYKIIVRVGKRVLDKRYHWDYLRAIDDLNFIEENRDKLYCVNATIEFGGRALL